MVSEEKGVFVEFPPVEVGQLYTGQEVFAHWAIKNDSPTAVQRDFRVVVLVDGNTIDSFTVSGLGLGQVTARLKIPFRVSEADAHDITLKVDAENVVAESDESDNVYAVTATWQIPVPTPTPTAMPLPTTTPSHTATPTPTPSPTVVSAFAVDFFTVGSTRDEVLAVQRTLNKLHRHSVGVRQLLCAL